MLLCTKAALYRWHDWFPKRLFIYVRVYVCIYVCTYVFLIQTSGEPGLIHWLFSLLTKGST